ncbi:MAG TPA: ABC transporter, partial [Clostridiaceae bacterium]|nr:ABC transporter [Clostridiaceae bacterium]
MNIITAENISKNFGMKKLFEEVTLTLTDTDKIGIIGVNGTGKSTLMKVLAGILSPDTGVVQKLGKVTISMLSQEPTFQEEVTVLQQVFQGNSEVFQTLRAYEEAVEKAQLYPQDEALQR